MTVTTREARLGSAFVKLSDSLVGGFDVVDILDTLVEECKSVLDVDEAGIVLLGIKRNLSTMASTGARAASLEEVQLEHNEGPCIDCFTTGKVVTVDDIERTTDWPAFRRRADEAGFRAVHAVPLRLRNEVIGALNLFSENPGALNEEDAIVAQALADVATIAILQYRLVSESSLVTSQLQSALDSRVIIEQAKGVISQHSGVSMDEAFSRLRSHARSNQSPLREVAATVVAQQLKL
ncbi:MAG: transcriptional regulator [Glaciihabitans sp.]|nr:transcriptional regulator [Glaciihabitans sp.]